MSLDAALKRDRYILRLISGVTLFLNNPKGSRCAVLNCYGIH